MVSKKHRSAGPKHAKQTHHSEGTCTRQAAQRNWLMQRMQLAMRARGGQKGICLITWMSAAKAIYIATIATIIFSLRG